MTTSSARLVRTVVTVLGLVCFVFPFAFRWYVSDADRYADLLRGGAPWKYLGTVAYQLIGTIVAPAMLALACALVALSLRDQAHFDHAPITHQTVQLRLAAVIVVAFTIATVIVVFRTPPGPT